VNIGKYETIWYKILSVTAFIFILFFVLPHSAHSKEARISIEYDNGFVSIQKSNIPRIKFLKELSEMANLQIIIIEDMDLDQVITLNFKNEPVEQILRHVLKGCSYAVIYNTSEKNPGIVLSYKNIQANDDRSESGKALNTKESARQILTQKIEKLRCRIESGKSDREYERWAKIRDPQFIVHDRDRLKQYQKQLNNL
jgi:protein-arginine kinase activator protein McsA